MASWKGITVYLLLVSCSLTDAADQCHCATSSACAGYPDGQCRTCEEFWSGSNCQIHNVARGDVNTTRVSDGDAGVVTDGEQSGHPDRCTSISDEVNTAFWRIILNKKHLIHRMKIVHYSRVAYSLRNFDIKVDLQLCKRWNSSSDPPRVLYVTCDTPLEGDLVSITIPQNDASVNTLALCEVEIYECGDFWYGDRCDTRCNCVDRTEICNKVTGFCNSGTRETTLVTSPSPSSSSTTTTSFSTTSTSRRTTTSRTASRTTSLGMIRSSSSQADVATRTQPIVSESTKVYAPTTPRAGAPTTSPSTTRQTPGIEKTPTEPVTLGAIAGVVVGTIVGVAVIAVVIVLVVMKMRAKDSRSKKDSPSDVNKDGGREHFSHVNVNYVGFDESRLAAETDGYEQLPCDKNESVYSTIGGEGQYEGFGQRGNENVYTGIKHSSESNSTSYVYSKY